MNRYDVERHCRGANRRRHAADQNRMKRRVDFEQESNHQEYCGQKENWAVQGQRQYGGHNTQEAARGADQEVTVTSFRGNSICQLPATITADEPGYEGNSA